MGVPREAVLTETKATNTGENIRFTQALLKEKGISAYPPSLILTKLVRGPQRSGLPFSS